MIEKMKLLHMAGPKEDIDRVMRVYLNKYEIHFENAMTSLSTLKNVRPFVETNMYKETAQKAHMLMSYAKPVPVTAKKEFTIKKAKDIIDAAYKEIEEIINQEEKIQKKMLKSKNWLEQIKPITQLDFEFQKLKDFHFIDYRFGRISVADYHKLEQYIFHNPYTLFYECNSDLEYVWGVYFVPHVHATELDAVYASFHFEDIQIPDDFEGTPLNAYEKGQGEVATLDEELKQLQIAMEEILEKKAESLYVANEYLDSYCDNFEIRKFAACIKHQEEGEFYILYGWMTVKDAERLEREIEGDSSIYCVEEEVDGKQSAVPPTKLKNPGILKPFEMFVEMYGLPAYNEMDPTLFVALTYTLMFGIMFGDVGQGLVLVLGGFLLYRLKGMRLAGIISLAGIWSTFFGVMYGSVFGFEELLPAVWMKPMDNIMTTLMISVGFGVALILIAMILNMINAVRAKEYGRLLFHQSGLAGLICYGFVAFCAVLFLTGHGLPATIIMGLAVGVPLVAILLKEPLSHFIERKAEIFPQGSKVMFFVEALVEGFDVVLSYATNTISFVRVGAFALSHAGMMGVVLTLAGFEKGDPNWIIIVLGNIAVTALEGLVVGIQVLRLEYYEMFSRFYSGSGKPFTSFKKKNQ
ncbi:MAG: V-type ATPase 116kDa subunit family protein [Lachnospiraceae bacterium]